MLSLYIGNKNYSSWSMRAAVLLDAFGLAYTEHKLEFDDFSADGVFKQSIGKISAAGKVPVLVDGDITVWDSLAIAEYVAEAHPEKALWPQDKANRAHARAITAEMHSGFQALRNACPMNIEADLAEVGQGLWQENADLRADVAYLEAMWGELLADGREFLFGRFCIADAFYAPVVMRLQGYGLPVNEVTQAYMARIQAHPAVDKWLQAALQEKLFVAIDEPYRQHR
ncbi:MAG: glutathione S-transferase family protein [Vitreoscilla sp.]|nr:glutathione S-transferase family protein [Vitreoscilla sp.]MBP9539780.1 glutathione S-transferase family protein [Vitreoscilla sp.]